MTKRTPVLTYIKNEGVFARAKLVFSSVAGEDGEERIRRIFAEFLAGANIFAQTPEHELGGVSAYAVTLDLKRVCVPQHMRNQHRPLSVLKFNGVTLMCVRPHVLKEEGLIFKLCPHEMLCNHRHFESEVQHYNRSYIEHLKQNDELPTLYHQLRQPPAFQVVNH